MCTSITLKSNDNNYLLARTMDFSFDLDPVMTLFPRNLEIEFKEASLKKHYAFFGLAKDVGSYYLADGLNEYGLSVAALYFESYAKYKDEADKDTVGIASYELVMWLLAKCKTVEEVIQEFNNITVINEVMGFLGVIPPLHWIVSDKDGNSLIIEIINEELSFHKNSIGLLTNSPDYNWHLTNVRSYIGLDPKQVSSRTLYGVDFKPFGQGSGTFGLPGDFTPPSRFIRTLYSKLSSNTAENSDELVLYAMHILNGVDIVKGNVVTPRATIDYTQYTSYMLNNDLKYYFRLHNSLNVIEYNLNDYNLDDNVVKNI